jgi:hypothetical protein
MHEILFGDIPAEVVMMDHRRAQMGARMRFEGALQANSAFARLIARSASEADFQELLRSSEFHPITTGRRTFSKEDALWIASGGRVSTLTIDDISFGEDMYVRSEVSTEETLKVGGIHLNPFIFGVQKPIKTTTRVGMYQINQTMYDWADSLMGRLSNVRPLGQPVPLELLEREFERDPEWVNDDTGIINRAIRDSRDGGGLLSAFLVSNDRRLANQMAQSANLHVVLVPPDLVIRMWPRVVWDSTSRINTRDLDSRLININRKIPPPTRTYIDTGSVLAVATRYEPGETTFNLRQITPISSGWNPAGKRFETYQLEVIPSEWKYKLPDRSIFYPVVRPKLRKSVPGGPESRYSSRSSWYRSEHSQSEGSRPRS